MSTPAPAELIGQLFGQNIANALAQHAVLVNFTPDECLFNSVFMPHEVLYFILTGEVRSFYSIDSSHLLVCEAAAGDLLNEEGLYGYGRSSTAIVLKQGTALALPYTMVHTLLQQEPALAMLLLKNLSHKVYGQPQVDVAA